MPNQRVANEDVASLADLLERLLNVEAIVREECKRQVLTKQAMLPSSLLITHVISKDTAYTYVVGSRARLFLILRIRGTSVKVSG